MDGLVERAIFPGSLPESRERRGLPAESGKKSGLGHIGRLTALARMGYTSCPISQSCSFVKPQEWKPAPS